MDVSVILTGVGTVASLAAINVGLISWLRSDMKSFESEVRGWREDFTREMARLREGSAKEMKDFHGRLCSLEARYHQENYKPVKEEK